MRPTPSAIEGLRALSARLYPGSAIDDITVLGPDDAVTARTRKGVGYGIPVRIRLHTADGRPVALVFHTARSDDFGHDRRADRAAELLLAYDTFGLVPGHVPAIDVGVIESGGALRSLAEAGEFYLVTGWAEGTLYADDLRRVATDGVATELDLERADALATYLAALHAHKLERPGVYTRAIRDLLGSGEGIFGLVDGYPEGVPGAPRQRLQRIEEQCLAWRWRLKHKDHRLTRIHGDFHPFNLVFGKGSALALLDAARGSAGDPADDVTALAVNYVFFALDAPSSWPRGLGALWRRFFRTTLARHHDPGLTEVMAPWLAWRALVVANPVWYPNLSQAARERLLGWVERVLDAPRFAPESAEELF
jgi:hypothetical protein